MIIKYRKQPVIIPGYEALLKRLPIYHPKKEHILGLLKNINAGYGGEERLDYLMKDFDPDYNYLLIQDLYVSMNVDFQADTVLLTQSCIILLEVKNIAGPIRVTVNPSALHQTLPDGKVRGYKSPFVQMEETKWRFEKLLRSLGYSLPVYSYVVTAYPNQIVESTPPGLVLWSADEVMMRLHHYDMPAEQLTFDELQALGQHLLNVATEYNPFPLATKLEISIDEIEKGVFCPNCKYMKMIREKRSWQCQACELKSPKAYQQALQEWFMLIKPTISVSECKDFLRLEHLSTARNILSHPPYKKIGENKLRKYYLELRKSIHEK